MSTKWTFVHVALYEKIFLFLHFQQEFPITKQNNKK